MAGTETLPQVEELSIVPEESDESEEKEIAWVAKNYFIVCLGGVGASMLS